MHGARRGQELPPGRRGDRSRGLRGPARRRSTRRAGPCRSPRASTWRRRRSRNRGATTRRSPRTSAGLDPAARPRRYEVQATMSGDAKARPTSRQPTGTIMDDHFPDRMEISFVGRREAGRPWSTRRRRWVIDGEEKGLRYGENPGQEAALYRLVNGNLRARRGDHASSRAGTWPRTSELLQSGQAPGQDQHHRRRQRAEHPALPPRHALRGHRQAQQPLRRGEAPTLAEAYHRAYMADRVAAFGGAIALNREVDRETAELIAETLRRGGRGARVRARRHGHLRALEEPARDAHRQHGAPAGVRGASVRGLQVPDRRRHHRCSGPSCPTARAARGLPARRRPSYKGKEYRINRQPTAEEYDDLLFGWLVESGVTSNSVLYVKDGVTVGIGTGEQDRVGVAEIARDKAYRKLADRLCWETLHGAVQRRSTTPRRRRRDRRRGRRGRRAASPGSCMVSDALLPVPRRRGRRASAKGVTAVVQPGGVGARLRGHRGLQRGGRGHGLHRPAQLQALRTEEDRMPLIDMPLDKLKTYKGTEPPARGLRRRTGTARSPRCARSTRRSSSRRTISAQTPAAECFDLYFTGVRRRAGPREVPAARRTRPSGTRRWCSSTATPATRATGPTSCAGPASGSRSRRWTAAARAGSARTSAA